MKQYFYLVVCGGGGETTLACPNMYTTFVMTQKSSSNLAIESDCSKEICMSNCSTHNEQWAFKVVLLLESFCTVITWIRITLFIRHETYINIVSKMVSYKPRKISTFLVKWTQPDTWWHQVRWSLVQYSAIYKKCGWPHEKSVTHGSRKMVYQTRYGGPNFLPSIQSKK